MEHAADARIVRITKLNVDFFDPAKPLPPHHLVWNLIGEVEIGARHLKTCERLLQGVRAPILNPPERIWPTSRAGNAERLARIPGLRVPKIKEFRRAELEGPGSAEALRSSDFSFPLLIRAAGFQGGLNFIKVERPEDLEEALQSIPGDSLTAHEYVDARDADGKIRKYRVVMVDGRIYPVHAAVSDQWKIHYHSAGMRDSPENRAEDRAFLEDMERVLGPKALGALEAVRDTLRLDYGGIDFSLTPDGSALFFEANATMVVPRPERAEVWDYRRPPVSRIYNAVTEMVVTRAGQTRPRRPAPTVLEAPKPVTPRAGRGGALGTGPSPLLLRLARASGLRQLGLSQEAQREIASVLGEHPDSVDALLANGSLLFETGALPASADAYGQAAALQPDNPAAQSGLGQCLLTMGRGAEARPHFLEALRLNPDYGPAHQGLSFLAAASGDLVTAKAHGRRARGGRSHYELPFRGTHGPTVLLLKSALGGGPPLELLIDRRGFHQTLLTVEYHDAGEPLPLHDILFNAVGGPDEAPQALERARAVASRSSAPRLNDPERVLHCALTGLGEHLADIPGLAFGGPPPEDPLYRVLVVGKNRLHALGMGALGTSQETPPATAQAEAPLFADPAAVLGQGATEALRLAARALDLDYVAFDFSMERSGGVRIRRADPSATPASAMPGPAWAHRTEAARRIQESVNDLLRSLQQGTH